MRFFNAILAALLFPLVDLLVSIIHVPWLTVYFLTASIHNAIWAYREDGFIRAVGAFALTLWMLIIPAIIGLILTLIYLLEPVTLFIFVILPMIDGFQRGWNGDVNVGFSRAKRKFENFFSRFNLPALFQGEVIVDPVLARIINALWGSRPMDELVATRATSFAALQLSQPEWEQLQTAQVPLLTEDEKSHLELINDLQTEVSAYEVFFNRLEVGDCPILLDRPEKNNTVLLTKQYLGEDGRWQPVPNQSSVFDKGSLERALAIHVEMTHPCTRDVISRPSAYREHPNAQTRYVWHPYYVNADSPSGISQELSGKALLLREHLARMPRLATAASVSPVVTLELTNAQVRANRVAYFMERFNRKAPSEGLDSSNHEAKSQFH